MSENVSPPRAAGRFPAGSMIAGYEIVELISDGGMAEVYKAWDERLRRQVALKIPFQQHTKDPKFRKRFIGEAQAAAKVRDPHIIPVFEAGEADGVPFIAMQFVGSDLRQVLAQEHVLTPERAAEFISPVASALDVAHAVRLVHRDVKPENILVDAHQGRPDHVYLSDFGVSKGAVSSVSLTQPGQFVGTVAYGAPEQFQGLDVDGRTDQYALACVAYELLTGAVPFERENDLAVAYAHISDSPPALSSRRPGLAGAADQVLLRAMAKKPRDRYGSCQDFADALREALGLPPYAANGAGTPRERATRRIGAPPDLSGDPTLPDPAADPVHGALVPLGTRPPDPAALAPTRPERERLRWLTLPLAIVIAVVIAGVTAVVIAHPWSPVKPQAGPTRSPTPGLTRPVTPTTQTNSAKPPAGPPSATVVTALMTQEADLSVAHRPADAVRLYAPKAFVRDDACGHTNLSQTWYGQQNILLRYQKLGAFGWLQHQNAEVSFSPDTAQANSATAKAQTAGYLEPSATSAGQEIHGNESWTFIRVNGKWLISSFIYNVCLAPRWGG